MKIPDGMDIRLKYYTRLPPVELWTDEGLLDAERVRSLTSADLEALLWRDDVRVVVAEGTKRPNWIPRDRHWIEWKQELAPHFAEPDDAVIIEEQLDEYVYWATEWRERGSEAPIVVLWRMD
jgi:hypothetical protein